MQMPLQVTFERSEPSDAVRAAIEREVERLETHNHRIIGCRVAVIAPSDKHRHGTGFQIHIWLTIPPHENIVVNRTPSDAHAMNMLRPRSKTHLPQPGGNSMISHRKVRARAQLTAGSHFA